MTKLAAFDLEIAKSVPGGGSWEPYFPLGITCAAVALEDQPDPIIWHGIPQLGAVECQQIVRKLEQLVNQGYTLLTWNGCKFDFHVLAVESGLTAECAALAADHVDLMLMFTFKQGHYLGLDKALKGAGVQGKRKQVILNNGEMLRNMDGAQAPALWARGEYDAVLVYLTDDVLQPLKLARRIEQLGCIRWLSGSGQSLQVDFDRLYSVRASFDFPQPDTNWMTNPPRRGDFVKWMPGGTLPPPAGA
jgi:hypothetical protein